MRMVVRTQLSMVEGKDNEAVTYVNSKIGFCSLRVVKGVDCLKHISDTLGKMTLRDM